MDNSTKEKEGELPMSNMTRVQFDLSPQKIQEIEDLMDACGIRTRKDYFSNALTFLEWGLRETKNGRIIASVDEEKQKYKEIVMPIFSSAARV